MTAGLVYFAGTVYWTSSVLAVFGGMPMILALVAMLLLAAYLAIYPAITAMVMGRLISQGGRSALFFAPAAWVATEYLRGFLFGGFPWVPLGNSQVTMLAVAQVASVLGVYGLSALVAFVNAAIAFALLTTGRSRAMAIAATRGVARGDRRLGIVEGCRRLADARGDAAPRGTHSRERGAGGQAEPDTADGPADLHDLSRDDARRRSARR